MAVPFDLTDLKLFASIADTGSLTRAAEHTYISLPAASNRIKNLEDNLGTKLLTRTTQGVTLTPAGETFLHHGRLLLDQLEHLRDDLKEYAQGTNGIVRVLANTSSALEFLPNVFSQYLARYPRVNIALQERQSYDIVRGVRLGSADIGIVSGSTCTDGLEVLPYMHYRLILGISPLHPIAKKISIQFNQTLDHGYVGLPEAGSLQGFLHEVAKSANKQLKLRIQAPNFDAQCRMIEANVGIGVLPEIAVHRYASRKGAIKIIQLTDEWAECTLKICTRGRHLLPKFAQVLVDSIMKSVPCEQQFAHA
jgi:DNA-binding transcriptional LysR family regulator